LVRDDEARKAGAVDQPIDLETGLLERQLCRWNQAVHCVGTGAEEIQISSGPFHVAMDDQCSTASERKILGFCETSNDPCDLKLEVT
jgi:hypothetical protein